MESIKQLQKRAVSIRKNSRALLVFTFFTAICSGMAAEAQAQTFAEWFKQGSTQKKYLLQQIAALQVFSGYLKQGYQIAHTGLSSISGAMQTENSLHRNYYGRMKTVSSTVKNCEQVKDITTWQQDILNTLSAIDQISGLTGEEKTYLTHVRSAVLKDCDNQMTTLQNVITDGKMQMSDAERLALIAKIHAAMLDNYHFAAGFTGQAKTYALRRQQEHNEILTSQQLYGIN